MSFGWLPPEVNSGLMYAGAGAGPMLAAASAWDGVATEMHTAAAGYNSVVTGLTSEGWMGPASLAMAAAATPYAAWLSATAADAEQTAAQARAAVAAYEAAFSATVPPAVVAANRAELATLVATNILGQNTPAIAANEALYAEMWAQDATTMDAYQAAARTVSVLTPFTQPKQIANPAAASQQSAAVNNAAATSAVNHAQSAAAAQPTSTGSTGSTGGSTSGSGGTDQLAAIMSKLNPYMSMTSATGSMSASANSIWNSLTSIAKNLIPAAAAGAKAAADAAAPSAAGSLASLTGLGSLGGIAAGLGHSGTIGALSVPQAWAGPVTGSLGSGLGGTTLASAVSATPGLGANPGGLLNGMPMLAHAARAAAAGDHTAAMPRFDLRPSVIPTSPAAG